MSVDSTSLASETLPAQLSFVIPVFNEEESLKILVNELQNVCTQEQKSYEIIFVDDGSTDQSWQVIQECHRAEPRIQAIRFRRNFGKAAALQAGFQSAQGDTVLTLDADLQDNPLEVPRFLAKLEEGYDVVSGYKQVRNDPWHKVFPSRVFNWMVSRVTGVKLHDHNCGFKAYRRDVTKRVRLYGELHRYVPVLAAAKGFRVSEITVNHRARQFGRSKFGWRRFLKGFLDLLSVRFTTAFGQRPMHFLGTIGVIFLLLFLVLLLMTLSILSRSSSISVFFLILTPVTAILAGQCFLAGFLAELMISNRPSELAYDICETLNFQRINDE